MQGQSVDYRKLAQAGWFMNYLHYREAVGTGGFQAELAHYSNIASENAAQYAPAYERVFARKVSPYGDISYLLPRKIFAHTYPEEGEPWAQEINGKPEPTAEMFAALFPLVPDKWKGATLWAWHRHNAMDPNDSPNPLLDQAPVRTFLNYPLNFKPEHPSNSIPLAWPAPTFGYYAFRNQWKGKDDFITQVFLKAHVIGGWNAPNAGTFRLQGLGHVWAHGPTDRHRIRWEENVVVLPDNPDLSLSSLGKLISVEQGSNGSGVVSIDLNDVYSERKEDVDAYSRYGGLRYPEAFEDIGLRGKRSIAVDYSGRSGAPCLLAIADVIQGGGSKVWLWQLAKSTESGTGDLDNTSVSGNTFKIRKNDGATLQGTFVSPADVTLTAEVREKTMIGKAGSPEGKELARPITALFAETTKATAQYFVVITVQRGVPPKIQVDREGSDTTVHVGEQTVSFDGAQVRFGIGP